MSSLKSSAPRSSPFRRPASPQSPTQSNNRQNTPPSTNRTTASPMTSPSKLKQSYTVSEEEDEESLILTPTKMATSATTTRSSAPQPVFDSPTSTRRLPQPPMHSPTKQSQSPYSSTPPSNHHNNTNTNMLGTTDSLSRLPPPLLHSLRESFSVLDPNSTGAITPSSVHETLQQLGLESQNTNILSQLFPTDATHRQQTLSLPQYLNQLASILIDLSPQQELLNAFSAFDDDDSGQIDVAELRRALLVTPPEAGERALTERDIDMAMEGFTGRRILGRGATGLSGVRGLSAKPAARKGGDVFRYQEFVGSLMGTALDGQNGQNGVPGVPA